MMGSGATQRPRIIEWMFGFWYHGGAFGTAWDSGHRAESHTLRPAPGVRCYPSVALGAIGSIEGIAR